MNPARMLADAADFFCERLAVVPENAWSNATPCPGWSVRVVAAHVVNGLATIPELLDGGRPDPALRLADHLGADPVAAARNAASAAIDAANATGALDVMVTAPAGTMPAPAFITIRAGDVVVHAWDLATGAGIDPTIPSGLVDAMATAYPRAVIDGGRVAGVFGHAVPIGSDAGPQTTLLAEFGRAG
ncbi:MAG: TIGR03086 family metal-binding protein [Mycobacteriales bacterium]